MSCGLVASARRKRKILALGRYFSANSSSIRCNVSCFCPLIGTFTKQSSGDQYSSSFGCSRTKSLACAIEWCGNPVSKVSTLATVGSLLDLNLFRLNFPGLGTDIAALSISSLTTLSFGLVFSSIFASYLVGCFNFDRETFQPIASQQRFKCGPQRSNAVNAGQCA